MMSSGVTTRPARPRPMFDYAEVDAKETSRAWARFLSDRDAPSLPMPGVRSVIYQSWVRSNSTGIKPEQFAAPTLDSAPQASDFWVARRMSELSCRDLLSCGALSNVGAANCSGLIPVELLRTHD